MDLFAPRHLLVILLIALVVFGTKKLKTIGSDLGSAVKGFKESMRDSETEATESAKQLGSVGSVGNAASAEHKEQQKAS